ncbi:hypothetical protein Ancab_023123 [Ancistrocladus abbreviatus]
MESQATRSGWCSSYARPVAILLTLLAVVSPLYIDRWKKVVDGELDSEELPINFDLFLPLLLLVLIIAITFSCFKDQSITRFDLYWIHRVGGSSGGLLVLLTLLVMVLSQVLVKKLRSRFLSLRFETICFLALVGRSFYAKLTLLKPNYDKNQLYTPHVVASLVQQLGSTTASFQIEERLK